MRAIGSMAALLQKLGETPDVPITELPPVPEGGEDLGQSMEFQLAAHGNMAAAWLVFANRKRFRRNNNVVNFHIPRSKETPPWFRIAFEYLNRRAGWYTMVKYTMNERIYRITRLSYESPS